MKIQCTQRQKEIITKALENIEICPFDDNVCLGCENCIEKKIEWEVTEG